MAVQLTDEMRAAVHAEDCDLNGHTLETGGLVTMTGPAATGGRFRADVGGPNDTTLPHMSCSNCGVVWLVWPQEFENYEAAVAAVRALMKTPDALRPKQRRANGRLPRAAGPGAEHGGARAADRMDGYLGHHHGFGGGVRDDGAG